MIFRKKTIKNDAELEPKSEHKSVGPGSIYSIFKNHPNELASDTTVNESSNNESIFVSNPDLSKPSPSKDAQLIQEIQKLEDRTIKPFVDYNEGSLFYPILSKIGEVQNNIEYLDGLVTDGILEQKNL